MGKNIIKLMLGVSLCMSSSLFVMASEKGIDLPKNRLILNSNHVVSAKIDSLTKQDKKIQIDNFKLAIDQKIEEKEVVKKNFEVVSPKLVIDSNIKIEPEILVSIRLLQPLDANISITRFIEPRSVVFSDDSKREIAEIAKNAPTYVSEEARADQTGLYDPVVSSTIGELSEYNDIYELYESSGAQLRRAHENYQLIYMDTLKKFKLEAKDLNWIIKNRLLKSKGYMDLYLARIAYETSAKDYLKCRDMYESYHKQVILSSVDMVVQGALPYYNYVLKDPKYGRYEIIIRDNESGEIIDEIFEFNIKAQENIEKDFVKSVDKSVKKGILGY